MTTAKLSAKQAAKEAGKATSTITTAIKNGKLSAIRNENGSFEIDPAELFRVYPKRSQSKGQDPNVKTPNNSKLLELEVKFLTEQVNDLKTRLDISEERFNEERNDRIKITALIANQNKEPINLKEQNNILPWLIPPIFIIALAAAFIAFKNF